MASGIKLRKSIHSANWSATTKYQTFCNLLSCKAPAFPFCGIFHYIKHFLTVSKVSVVHVIEVSVTERIMIVFLRAAV